MSDAFSIQDTPVQGNSGARASFGGLGTKGGNARGTVSASPLAGTFDGPNNFVPQFFNDLLAPNIEAIRRQKFYGGYAAARAGKTVSDIKKDQPWFANQFGSTPYAEGATVYTAEHATQEMVREVHENMDTFKDKTPEEMGSWLNAKSASMLTGDVLADAVVQKKFLDASGPIMEAQTKARYSWQQQQMQDAQNNAVTSAGRTANVALVNAAKMGQQHPDQALTQDQQLEILKPMYQLLGKPDGQNTESYLKTVENSMLGLAREDNWYAANAIRDSGLMGHMPIEQQERVEKGMVKEEARFRSRLDSDPAMKDYSMLSAMSTVGALSPQGIDAKVDEINNRVKTQFGYKGDYIDGSTRRQLLSQGGRATFEEQLHQDDKAQRAREKALEKGDKDMAAAITNGQITSNAAKGSLGVYLLSPGTDKKQADYLATNMFDQTMAKDPAHALDMLINNARHPTNAYTIEPIKQRFHDALSSGGGEKYTDAVGGALTVFQSLINHKDAADPDSAVGIATARRYFGDDYDKLDYMNRDIKNGLTPEEAYRVNFTRQSETDDDLRAGDGYKKNQGYLGEGIDTLDSSWLGKFFGGSGPLSPSAKAFITYKAGPEMSRRLRTQPYINGRALAQQAVQWFGDQGGEIAGRFAWMNNSSDSKVAKELGLPPSVLGDVMDQAVINKARKAGFAPNNDTSWDVHRLGRGKDMKMIFHGYANDGKSAALILQPDDFNKARERVEEVRAQSHRKGMTTNDAIGNTVYDGE